MFEPNIHRMITRSKLIKLVSNYINHPKNIIRVNGKYLNCNVPEILSEEWCLMSVEDRLRWIDEVYFHDSNSPTLREVSSLLQLDKYSLDEIIDLLTEQGFLTKSTFNVKREVYQQIMNILVRNKARNDIDKDIDREIDRLFVILSNHSTININDLICGLSTFCLGSRDEKVSRIFRFLDRENKGYINASQLTNYLKCIYCILYQFEINLDMEANTNCSPQTLAMYSSQDIFSKMGDDKLTFDRFRNWYLFESGPHTQQLEELFDQALRHDLVTTRVIDIMRKDIINGKHGITYYINMWILRLEFQKIRERVRYLKKSGASYATVSQAVTEMVQMRQQISNSEWFDDKNVNLVDDMTMFKCK